MPAPFTKCKRDNDMVKNLDAFLRDFYKEDDKGRTQADKKMATLTITQLYTLIDKELAGRKSSSVLKRLHRRLTRLRSDAERARLEKSQRAWRV